MSDTNISATNTPPADSQNKPTAQPDATLQDVLDTLHNSDFFPQAGKDAPSQFWSAYERVARQHDDEFLERHNEQMDVLLIFAGLFSAVSSAFIVNMGSSLIPDPADTTNALLMTLINIHVNDTFPAQMASLPVWTGPSSITIWIQSLAYASLSSSLLAAFGAVLAKQWLAHFKTSRFGKGALHERCQRRQLKFNALEASYFSIILDTLPMLLQLSLLFFGIALAANIWTQQHTVASVVITTTSFGVLFYCVTVVESLKSLDCPFQTPVSSMVQYARPVMAGFRMGIRKKWEDRPQSWAAFLYGLRQSSRRASYFAANLITKLFTPLIKYLSQHLEVLRHWVPCLVHSPEAAGDVENSGTAGGIELGPAAAESPGGLKLDVMASEGVPSGSGVVDGDQSVARGLQAAGGSEQPRVVGDIEPSSGSTEAQTAFFEKLDLIDLDSSSKARDLASSNAVQWTLETSTDMDIIATAANMIPELEWPSNDGQTDVAERLKDHFHACFDTTRQILPLAQTRAMACLKAIYHIYDQRELDDPFQIWSDGTLLSTYDYIWYHMLPDHDFLVVHGAMDVPVNLDIGSLSSSDRLWIAHVFTYRLHKADEITEFAAFVVDFIGTCLDSESPRLAADCLLLAGVLMGMEVVGRRHLARLDKSKAIEELRESVTSSALDILLGNIQGHEWRQRALKLIHPLLQHFLKNRIYFISRRTNERCIKYCFRLLEEDSGTEDDGQVRSSTVARLIRNFSCLPDWETRDWYTQRQFDLLVDYACRICKGSDNDAILHTFWTLLRLRGSPSTPDRMHRYIDSMVPFMGQKLVDFYRVLEAVYEVRTAVASIGRDDEAFREHFSTALASVALSDATQPVPLDRNPFKKLSFLKWNRDMPYLKLLSTLSQDAIWQPQLRQRGHFDNCFAMADTLSWHIGSCCDKRAVPLAHLFANIHVSSEDHMNWPLILRAWRYVFNLEFFGGWRWEEKSSISTMECIEALPYLAAYAKMRGDNSEEPLIPLVEQVCQKLDEEKQLRDQGKAPGVQEETTVGSQGVRDLAKQIREILDSARLRDLLEPQRDV